MSFLRICQCSHDRETHYEVKHNCLAMLCDCQAYADRDDPKPVAKKPAPQSYSPVAPPDTIPTPLLPCPMWCMCAKCIP